MILNLNEIKQGNKCFSNVAGKVKHNILLVCKREEIDEYTVIYSNEYIALIIAGNYIYYINDRIGQFPSYYSVENSEIIVSDSILDIYRQLDKVTYNYKYFMVNMMTDCFSAQSSMTPFNEITQLDPSCYIKFDYLSKTFSVERYYDFGETNTQYCESDLIEILSAAINNDIDFNGKNGFLLSGGFDSSLITSLASKTINTYSFSIVHDKCSHERNDDGKYVEEMINYLGEKNKAQLVEYHINWSIDTIDCLINLLGTPLYDQRVLSWLNIFSAVKSQDINNVFGGEGADELWYGYYPMKWNWMSSLYYTKLDTESIYLYFSNNYKKYLLSNCLNDFSVGKSEEVFNYYVDKMEQSLQKEKLSNYLIKYVLWGLINIESQIAKYFKLKLNLPFTDYLLVDYALSLTQEEHLLDSKMGKDYLKRVFEEYLPKNIVYRKKAPLPKSVKKDTHLWNVYLEHEKEILNSKMVTKFYNVDKLRTNLQNEPELFYGNVNDSLLQLISLWRYEVIFNEKMDFAMEIA